MLDLIFGYFVFILGISLLLYLIKKINSPTEELRSSLFSAKHENTNLKKELEKLNDSLNKNEINISSKLKNLTEDLNGKILEIKNKDLKIIALDNQIKTLQDDLKVKNSQLQELEKGLQKKDELFRLLKSSPNEAAIQISSMYSDFMVVQFEYSAKLLEEKKKPAFVEAQRIRDLAEESKTYISQFRQMAYKYESLLLLFPELAKYVDDFDSIRQLENAASIGDLQENFDRVQNFVSKEEYKKLSVDERNQLALDRYLVSQKSKWQIGRDYELFCGMEYEKLGWQVNYFGIDKKIEDMGRDLIAIKGSEHHVVQCKYWSKEKEIHEKHITQLYGTTIEYSMNCSSSLRISPVFITNIKLSERAKAFSQRLGVVVRENVPIENFPRIKCNINKDQYGNESKIYHLPFDQQYDNTKISKKGEFYAFTVEEATKRGFRRAFKYFG